MSEIGRGGINEEDSDDGLWSDFETSAQAVAHLFRNSNWRNLQAAAGSTTQLYKNGLEFKKRAFEKGFISGRQALAKEIFGLCRYSSKINVEDLVTLLSRYTVLPEDFNLSPSRRQRNSSNSNSSNTVSVVEGSSAVNLFQQALCHTETSTVHRSPELNNFLQNQLYRHRKRPHSPGTQASANSMDSMASSSLLNKRFKRLQ